MYASGFKGGILKSTDNGKTWESGSYGGNFITPTVQDIHFLDENTGFLAGGFRLVVKTTNGGDTWVTVLNDTMSTSTYSYGVWFKDQLNGVVVGQLAASKDLINYTTNGGATWKTTSGLVNKALRDVGFGTAQNGAAVGDGMKIVMTTDGGAAWTAAPVTGLPSSLGAANLKRIAFVTPTKAYAAGGKAIVVSNNGGGTWAYQDSVLVDQLDIKFRVVGKDTIGCMVGGRAVYKSTNAGRTWANITDSAVVTSALYSCMIDPSGYLFVGSLTSTIWTNAPLTSVKQDDSFMPSTMSLSQNFPNPFNPSTTIKYALNTSGLVTVKVYDMIGRLVDVLVNEQQAAGSYTLNFTPASYASGVYIYELRQGSSVLRNRMMLLK